MEKFEVALACGSTQYNNFISADIVLDLSKHPTVEVVEVHCVLLFPARGQEGGRFEDGHELAVVGQGVEFLEGH